MNSIKQIIMRSMKRNWYRVWGLVYKLFYENREYVVHVPSGTRIYSPWYALSTNEYNRISNTVYSGGFTMQPPSKRYFLYSFVKYAVNLTENMAECGVAYGGTAHVIAETIAANVVPPYPLELHLFDTFTGFPASLMQEALFDTTYETYRDTSLNAVKNRLKNYAEFCCFYPGVIPESFQSITNEVSYSFVNIDVDLYATTKACCEWFWPRMVAGGVILINDAGNYRYRNDAKAAVDEFFSKIGIQPIVLPTGQVFVIKSPQPESFVR